MKFGKLQDISNVNFALPPNHPNNQQILSNIPKREGLPKVFLGCTGWNMKEWIGTAYPAGTKAKDFLKQYVKQFNTIELNTTHYRIPNATTIQKWKMTAPKDFQYCPKIPQTISHSRDLGKSNDNILLFCEMISGLEEHLGCSFMQLPPYFNYTRLPILEDFLKRFPSHIPLAIEVRHEDWFENAYYFEQLAQLCETHQVALVITDVAGRRDVLHQRLTNQTAMVRFVGNGLHSTDYERADDWVERLKEWFEQGLHQVYFFPHQPDNLLAPEMCEYFAKKIKETFEAEVRGPNMQQEQGGQISLF